MAFTDRTKISEYDATAANNINLGTAASPAARLGEYGVDADAEAMRPSDTNGALRELMAHLKAMDAGTSVLTSPKAGQFLLEAISASITATAVDVFVYDTSKDSDGGAWRKRCQHTSWYNETLNTATRGSRREFPAVAVIVAEADTVTIYDGDDPALPMWMVFEGDASGPFGILRADTAVTSLSAINGVLAIGSTSQVQRVRFVSDTASPLVTSGAFAYNGGISQRNASLGATQISSVGIVNNTVNDVALTVLPDAPTDPATGLPVPTIAVATDGGVSVIKDDGTVVDITCASASFTASTIVDFKGSQLWMNQGAVGSVDSVFVFNTPPTADTALTLNSKTGTGADADAYYKENPTLGDLTLVGDSSTDLVNDIAQGAVGSNEGVTRIYENPTTPASGMVAYTTSTYNTGWLPGDIKGAFLADTDDTDLVASGELVTNGTFDTDVSGWTASDPVLVAWDASGAIAVSTVSSADTYAGQTITTVPGRRYLFTVSFSQNVGTWFWISSIGYGDNNLGQVLAGAPSGSITLQFTALTTTTYITLLNYATGPVTTLYDNVSVIAIGDDRSVNNNGMIVNGTVTRTAVATGADLVAYSGFSASNYLEQPYNSDLDFGTGDFCVMGWIKQAANTAVETILERDSATTAQRFTLAVDASGFLTFTCDDDTTARTSTTNRVVDTDVWTHFTAIYDGAGDVKIYLDGALDDTETGSALLTLDNTAAVLSVGLAVDGAEPLTNGDVALLRISATVPTAAQIAKIYEDEKFLFQDNAACTLYGASDAVTALAHDSGTGLLHVGTSAGRSVFQGLRRVDNTTTAVETAISASGGLVVEE